MDTPTGASIDRQQPLPPQASLWSNSALVGVGLFLSIPICAFAVILLLLDYFLPR